MPITITNNNSVVGVSQEVNTIQVGMASAFDASATALQAAADADTAKTETEILRDEVVERTAALGTTSVTTATWADLSTLTPNFLGQGAETLDSDTGTHTDPSTSETVANAGRYTAYALTEGAWTWIGETGLSGKVSVNPFIQTMDTAWGGSAFFCDSYGCLHLVVDEHGGTTTSTLMADHIESETMVMNTVSVTYDEDFYIGHIDAYGCVAWLMSQDGSQVGGSPGDMAAIAGRGSRDDLNDRISQGIDAYGNIETPWIGAETLRDWSVKSLLLRSSGESAVIGCIGDSWTQRFNPGYVTYLRNQLIVEYGDGGLGWVPFGGATNEAGAGATVSAASFQITVNKTGTWIYASGNTGRGPDLKETTSATATDMLTIASSSLTYAATLNLLYLRKSGGGVFRWRVNGGAWTTVATENSSDALGTAAIIIPAGSWYVDVEVVSGSVTLFGADHRNTESSGSVVHRLGASGSTAMQWATGAETFVTVAAWEALGVDIWTVMLGTNDQGSAVNVDTFRDALTSVIDGIRSAKSGADIALVIPFENLRTNIIPMSSYRDSLRRCASENSTASIDMVRIAGANTNDYDGDSPRNWITESDNIHPQSNGYAACAAAIYHLLKI